MLYFTIFTYSPDTAPTNRFMAYIKALSENGVKVCVCFFFPDNKRSKVKGQYPNIEFVYFWERAFIDIPLLNKISLRYYINKFVSCLNPGDQVYVYCFPDLVQALSRRKDIGIYVEITEHPDVSFPAFLKGTSQKGFIDACKGISGIIVISRGLMDYMISRGCKPEKIIIVNMFTDTTRFQGLSKQNNEPYVAYCGTASNNKDGVDQLVVSFSEVVNKYPNYKLYIIGSTPSNKERFANLDLVKQLGLENNVIFTGHIESVLIPQMLKNASILALDRPDNLQAKYGFPTKLGEYLMTSNPVVITNVGDISYFFKDGYNAMIASPNNPQDFSDKIIWLIEHPEEAIEIGIRGRNVAYNNFNYINETNKLLCFLDK